jgi:hypothetical protein
MTPKRIRESLLVVDAINLELASLYSGLGAKRDRSAAADLAGGGL